MSELAADILKAEGLDLRATNAARHVKRADRETLVVAWTDVFGVAHVPRTAESPPRVLVLVSRAPPRAPWIAVEESDLPSQFSSLDSFSDAIEARLAKTTYRSLAPTTERLSADALLARARARAEIPGAVEIPIRPAFSSPLEQGAAHAIFAGMGCYSGVFCAGGVAQFVATLSPVSHALLMTLVTAGGVLGAGAGGILPHFAHRQIARSRRRRGDRVLLLAPDGAVFAFLDGVLALPWEAIGEIGEERDDERKLAVVVRSPEGKVHGRIYSKYFSVPVSTAVAVARAYRARAARR